MGAITAGTSTRRAGRSLVRADFNGGDVDMIPFSLTMSNSYATGGDTGFLAASGLAAGSYRSILFTMIRPANGYTFVHDAANDKLLAYTSGGTQTTSTTDLSAVGLLRGIAYVVH
jgi:hypothetical protein